MRGMEKVTSLQHPGFALPLHVLASARKTTAQSSTYPLGNCVRLSEVMQDKDVDNLLLGSSQKGLSADSLKGGKEKAKAKVRPSQMSCPRKRVMANST
jgi:hypothetical protein